MWLCAEIYLKYMPLINVCLFDKKAIKASIFDNFAKKGCKILINMVYYVGAN